MTMFLVNREIYDQIVCGNVSQARERYDIIFNTKGNEVNNDHR